MRNLRINEKPLPLRNDRTLSVYNKFPLSFDTVKPLEERHATGADDRFLVMVDSDQFQG